MGRKRKTQKSSSSNSDVTPEHTRSVKKSKQISPIPPSGTSTSVFETDSDEFEMEGRTSEKGNKEGQKDASTSSALAPPDPATISNADLLSEIKKNRQVMESLRETMDQMRGEIFDLKQANDELKKEAAEAKRREEKMKEEIQEIRQLAKIAEARANELDMYSRRNNIRIYGIPEECDMDNQKSRQPEPPEVCEEKVLRLLNTKLKVPVTKSDVEVTHRVGRPDKEKRSPRGVIIRFVSRRVRDQVLHNRRELKGTGVVIVEDLNKPTQNLFHKVKESDNCIQAWTKNGKIFMKDKRGFITHISSVEDLLSQPLRPHGNRQ